MSFPGTQDAGGQQVPVTSAAIAAPVTESAPVTIINTSTRRVWLGGSSSLTQSQGVPLEPLTSFTWDTPGQVWALLDQAGDPAVTLIVTGTTTDWRSSPVAAATQTALQLAATGIRTRQIFDSLGAGFSFGIPANSTVAIDTAVYGYPGLDEYGTIVIAGTVARSPGDPSPQPIGYQWGNRITTDRIGPVSYIAWSTTATPPHTTGGVLTPTYGSVLYFTNPNPYTVGVKLFGINQSLVPHAVSNGYSPTGFSASVSIPAGAAVGTYPLALASGALFQGPAALYVLVQYAAAPSTLDALQIAVTFASVAQPFSLIDTSFMQKYNAATWTAYPLTALPASLYSLVARVSASSSIARTITVTALPNY